MKTLTTIFLALVISAGSAFAQPVKDKAVIPIGVTLNSILRLNIESGGNIEFVFNTLDHYNNGINDGYASSLYRTTFTVASSSNFDVDMGAEGDFRGADATATSFIPIGQLEYRFDDAHGGVVLIDQIMSATMTEVVDGLTTGNAGDIAQNLFTVDWKVGCTTPLLGTSLPSDRYVTNILIEISIAE
jgi:hypothetical protein